MTGLSWVPDVFAGIMIAVAAVSAARLAVATSARRWLAADADAAHLLMATAMAGMLVTGLRTLPAGVWEPAFGVLAAWFAGRVAREARGPGPRGLVLGCHAPHLVHSLAMLYMFLALGPAPAGGGGMAGMAGAGGLSLRLPTLALVLALVLAGYAVRDLDRLTSPGAGWLAAPAVARVPQGASAAVLAAPGGPASAVARATAVAVTGSPTWAPFGKNNGDGRPAVRVRSGLAGGPWLAAAGRIAMGVTMAYMLIVMI